MFILPGFEWIPADAAGGGYVDAPWRLVLHSTEGASVAGALSAYHQSKSWPLATVDPATKRKGQHYSTDVSQRALMHPERLPETNKAHALSIEIVGFATEIPNMPADQLEWLANEVVAPIRAVCPFQLTAPMFVRYPDSYGMGAAQRFSWAQWGSFNGICGHQHVPGNDHGDPGAIDITKILTSLQPKPQPQQEMDMTPGQCLDSTGREWVFVVGDDKQVHAYADGALLPFPITPGTWTSGVSARLLADGRIALKGRGNDGHLWQLIFDPAHADKPGAANDLGGHIYPAA
jgi:hypothetical protein